MKDEIEQIKENLEDLIILFGNIKEIGKMTKSKAYMILTPELEYMLNIANKLYGENHGQKNRVN